MIPPSEYSARTSGLSTLSELASLNADFAALLHLPPVDLVLGADRSLQDALVVCGILGGKDVGKSTLINALAEMPVSRDEEEVGAGTSRPMAYIHRDAVAEFRARFAGRDGLPSRLDFTEHAAAAIRNVVLVDLPDFDSDLPQHFETVQAVAPLLDRIIWVTTPRKIVDRAWVGLLRRVVKDHRNVFCVLNKTDELLADDASGGIAPESFWRDQEQWVDGMLQRVDYPTTGDRRFLIAAAMPTRHSFVSAVARRWNDADWSAYGPDRPAVEILGGRVEDELRRLRGRVLTPVGQDEAAAIKQANQVTELQSNVSAIIEGYRLQQWRGDLAAACESTYYQALLEETFGAEFCPIIAERVMGGRGAETALADRMLESRIEPYFLLRMVYWPLRWLVRRVGRGLAARSDAAEPGRPDDPLEVQGRPAADRIRELLGRLAADHARAIRQFQLADKLPDPEVVAAAVSQRARALARELDAERQRYTQLESPRRSRPFAALLWAILAWFPLGQPLTEGLLRLAGAGGKTDFLGGALQLVVALSATHLLKGLAVAVAVYLLILAGMYARCVGRVRASTGVLLAGAGGAATERVQELLADQIVRPAAWPFVETRLSFESLFGRLERLTPDRSGEIDVRQP